MIHSFVTSKLNRCNVLCMVLHFRSTWKLKLVQNLVACILSGASQWQHMSLVLHDLHCLILSLWIESKVFLLIYKAINGLGPCYLRDFLSYHAIVPQLWSAEVLQWDPPSFKRKGARSRVFSMKNTPLLNRLPLIQDSWNLLTFSECWKTNLYTEAAAEVGFLREIRIVVGSGVWSLQEFNFICFIAGMPKILDRQLFYFLCASQ